MGTYRKNMNPVLRSDSQGRLPGGGDIYKTVEGLVQGGN